MTDTWSPKNCKKHVRALMQALDKLHARSPEAAQRSAVAIALLAASCSAYSDSSLVYMRQIGIDDPCTQLSDCKGVGSCLPRSQYTGAPDGGGGCTADTSTCSYYCTTDKDCASYGNFLKCQPGCNGAKATCVRED